MYEIGEVVFGSWKIARKIGQGSFGTVYELRREEFGEVYRSAMKVIRVPQNESEVHALAKEGMSEREIQRYLYGSVTELVREFAIMAKLKATGHVVSYEDHTVLPHDDGIGWDILIRMELLKPLLDYADLHPFTHRDVIQLGIDMCKALELCQKYNIIHRDIKPDNIFVGETGAFKLGDFGIARTIEKTVMSDLSKKGTYNYMAPEVYAGGEYGFSVDTYSLGIVLYRLLNRSRIPFLPEPPKPITVNSRERALARRMSGEPIPAPYYGRGRLGEIVLKACAYDPSQRYSSPARMRQDLEAILYDANDGDLIYPEGDQIQLIKNEYASRSSENRTQVEEAALDSGTTVTEINLRQTRGGKFERTATQKPSQPGQPDKPKKRRRWIPLALLIALAIGAGLLAARWKNSRSARWGAYTACMQQAQQYRDVDPLKAMELYRSAQDMEPEEEAPFIAYAYTLYAANRYEACVSYIENDLALGKKYTEDGQSQLMEILGAAYFELDEYAAAASFFRLSTAGGSITVPAMRDYAVSLGRLGDIQGANEVMKRMQEAGAAGSVMTYVQAEIHYAMDSFLLAEDGFRSTLGSADDQELRRRALRSLAELYRDCILLEKRGSLPSRGQPKKRWRCWKTEFSATTYNLIPCSMRCWLWPAMRQRRAQPSCCKSPPTISRRSSIWVFKRTICT